MKGKKALVAGYIVVVALVAPAALSAAGDEATTSSGAVVAPGSGEGDEGPSAAASQAPESSKQVTHEVAMRDIEFVPKKIGIDVGDTVTWRNEDSVDHNAIADDGSFESGNFGEGETFSATISEAGTIPYVCTLHSGMKGTIVAGGGSGESGSGGGSGDESTGSGTSDGSGDDPLISPDAPSGVGSGTSAEASGDSSLPTTGSDGIWLAIAGAWLLGVGAAIRAAVSGAR